MKLSAPIFRLKRQARLLARDAGIPLNKALDRVARDEGFQSWSLLATRYAGSRPACRMLAQLEPGDLVLLGARPGHGKTMTSLDLIVEAIKSGAHGVFYTFEYTEVDILNRLRSLGADPATLKGAFTFDTSEQISADYIIDMQREAHSGTVIVVDYLQLLDQNREKPALSKQVSVMKSFAQDTGVIFVLNSQIDRTFDQAAKGLPDVADVRLPNPLDLALFSKACFLNDGAMKITSMT